MVRSCSRPIPVRPPRAMPPAGRAWQPPRRHRPNSGPHDRPRARMRHDPGPRLAHWLTTPRFPRQASRQATLVRAREGCQRHRARLKPPHKPVIDRRQDPVAAKSGSRRLSRVRRLGPIPCGSVRGPPPRAAGTPGQLIIDHVRRLDVGGLDPLECCCRLLRYCATLNKDRARRAGVVRPAAGWHCRIALFRRRRSAERARPDGLCQGLIGEGGP